MAEPANLTQAEILARQRMLEEALARQAPDAELFNRINDPRPTEPPVAGRQYVYGAPDAEYRGLPAQIGNLFRPTRQEIIEPTEVEYGDPRTVFNPLTGQLDQVQDREVTFGQYGGPEFGLEYMPAYRALRSGVDYASDLLTDPEKRAEAAEMVKQLPEAIERQMKGSMEGYEKGYYTTRDPETGEEYRASDVLLGSTAPPALGTAIALKGVDDGVALGAGPNKIVLEGFGEPGQAIRLQGFGDERKDPPPSRLDESGSPKDLLFTHELREDELWTALDSGGLSSPSLGLGRETEMDAGFGEIILVGKQEAFDPANDSRNIIFSADAYTPRHPPTFFKQKQEIADPEVRAEKIREDFGFMETISNFSDTDLAWANDGFGRAGKYPVTGKIIGFDYGPNEPSGWFLNEKENPLLVYKFLKDEGYTEASGLSLEVPPRLRTDTYDPELTNNALKVINDNIESSSEARSEIVRILSETLEGNPALQERYEKWLKGFKSRYVEADEKGEPVAYLERYGDDGTTLVEATPENVVQHMKAEDLRLGEGSYTQNTSPGPMFARTARELPSNIEAKQYADTPDSGDGITRLLKEKDFGWGSQTVTPQQLRSTSVKHFQEATEEILDELPIPHSLRAEFLNKAVQLAPDVDAVRAVVRERYGSLVDMAKKPSLTSFILGENTTKSSTPINDYFNRSFQRRLNKSNLEDQIEKTTQDILKFERHAQRTPKKYFEAKPQRVVGMDEFAGAIVPTYASEDLVNALKAQGLKVVRYRQGVNPRDADRAWNSVVDAKQQFRDEMFSISGDGGLTAATLGAVEEIAPEETENNFADGGMVTGMNRSPQAGPLARQVVPRETMAPMGYNTGGSVFQPGQQSLQPSTRQDFQTFLASNPPDKYGRQYGGQQYGEDVYQDTPESFKLMAEEAGFGDMPAVYSGMVDSQDIPGGIDPVTGKQWGGGSVGLNRRRKLAKYFEQTPGAKEFWQSNFGEKAPPEGFGGPDQGLFQGGPQLGLAQEFDTSTAPEPLTPAPAPITPPPQELDTSTAPAPITPVTPPPAPPPPLAVEAAQEQEPSVVPKEVTESLSPSSSQYGGIGGLQGFVQFIQMLPTMAQLYQQIRGGGQGFSSGFNTPYSGFSTSGNYGGSSPYQHARSYQTGGGVFGMPDFMGRVYGVPDQEEATAAETLAATPAVTTTSATSTNQGTLPSGLSPLQKRLIASGELQLEDLGYPKGSYDPVVTSVFETTPTASEELIEETQEPVVTDPIVTDPIVTTTEEPVVETTTEPIITTTEPVVTDPVVTTTDPIVETTEPLTPFEPTTQETLVEPTVVETTTEPTAETVTTTEPVVDTAPLVVTEPLASEELASTTVPVEEEPVVLVPSPTEDDVPVFTVQEQPDAPDEQPFVPITGVSPDLSVNQYLDTTYQTGYPTTQGMEIKESLIPGQEYSAERLAAGQMIDVIRPDLGSGADLPSVDFSNINFDVDDDTEELEVVDYEKPEFISTDPTTGQDPNFASGRSPQDFLADSQTGNPINWKTVGEGTMDFLTNPLRGLEGLASNVADRIWSKRPEFFLSAHVKNKDGSLKLDTNGKPIRRNGMGTLINRVLDKIYEERPNILFKEYINKGEEEDGEVYGTLRDKVKPNAAVSDETEAGQQTFLDRLWSGLGKGLNMLNPFKYVQSGEQQRVGYQTAFPDTTPVVTDVTFDEEGKPVFSSARFLGEIQGTNLSAARRRQFNEFYGNLSAYDRAVIERARSKEYEALYDSMNFDAEGSATGDSPLDAEVQLLNFIDPEGKSEIPSVAAARKREKEIATMKTNMRENGYTEEQVYELGQKALQGDVAAMQDLMALQGRSQDFIENYITSFTNAQRGGRAREAYEMASGGANRWGTARFGSIQERASGFSPASYHVGSEGRGIAMSAVPNEPPTGTRGGLYEGPRGGYEGLASIVAGTGRLPSASGSWGGLNPFFESPQPGDPMYADFLMDTMGPGKNFENEIQGMVDAQVPFFEAVGEDGRYYLMSKETGEVLYGPYDNPNTGGGSPSPGGGMADGGPVVRNVGETEGIAGLFEDMMGPGTVDETERVYKYPGGTMTERVSRGSFNMRTG